MNLLSLSGTPYQIGYEYGKQFATEIRHFAEDRVSLSMTKTWTGHELPRTEIMRIAQACLAEHQQYAPELMDELQGVADATGCSLEELLILNGFTDFVDTVHNLGGKENSRQPSDNCTAFLVPGNLSANGKAFYGQTWDMHASATPYVMLLRLATNGQARAILFTVVGCVGMIGMNEHGICVGINNLLGADGQIGVMWPFVVRKILQQENLAAALNCITSARLAGAHNYMLMDAHGDGYNVEAMSTHYHLTKLEQTAVVHSNHCLNPRTNTLALPRLPASQLSSERRLNRAQELLAREGITLQDLFDVTADEPTICVSETPPYHVETCGAAVMCPAIGEFWAVQGKPSLGKFERFSLL